MSKDLPNNVIAFDFKKASINNNKANAKEAEKRSLFDEWLHLGTVMVTFLTDHPLVEIPKEFKDKPLLNLNFCHKFHVKDFNFNEIAVWGTLSFNSGEHFCRVPWSAIVCMRSLFLNKSQLWLKNDNNIVNYSLIE